MGNQNATAVQQDGDVNDLDSKSVLQENVVPNINSEEKQISAADCQVNEGICVGSVKEESDRPEETDAPEFTAALGDEEHKGNEELEVTNEAEDQASVHDEATSDDSEPVAIIDPAPLNDTSIIENDGIQDELMFADNQTSENHALSESETADIDERDTHDVRSIHGSAHEPFSEDHKPSTEASTNHELNADETVQVHQAIDMTEEKLSEEVVATPSTVCGEISSNKQHSETDTKCSPQPGSVEVDLGSTENGTGSDPDHTETGHLLKAVKDDSISDTNVVVEETTKSVADTHDSIKVPELASIQNDMLVTEERTTMTESRSCIEEMSAMKSETHIFNDDQMDDRNDVKETADTHSVLAEPVASDEFHDADEHSENNINMGSKSAQDKIRCLVITQETEPTKPVIEGFIFADHLRDGEVMLDSLKCNLQIEKCPSFNFDIKNDMRTDESNHTPLLYQNKPPTRSLSSPGNVFLNIPSETHHFKEKTIILERTDSEKSKAPLLGTEETKHQTDGSQNGHLNGEMLQLAKTRQKHRARPSFFSSCVCCAGVDQLNADF